MPPEAPLLVVVTGPPGAGKSTVARALADELRLPLVAKDDFKETLFEHFPTGTVEESQRLGVVAWELLFRTAAGLLGAGVSLVLEGNFSDPDRFARLPPARVVQLHLSAPPALLVERYRARPRHPGHQSEAYAPEIERRTRSGEWDALNLQGSLIAIDTSDPVDVPDLARRITG